MKFRTRSKRVVVAVSLLAYPAVAFESAAQTASGPDVDAAIHTSSDIVVTAQRAITATKDDTPLVETPESISVVTRDRLDRQGVTDSLTEILRYVPGVQAEPYGFNTGVDRFVIRGFDASAFGLYRDSLQLPSFGDSDRSFRIEPYGLERLEILRGPSSVLYGNGSLGGLVNAISKRPTNTSFGEIELEAGNFNRYAGKFDVGGPIDQSGVFSYRLTGLARDSDTQINFVPDNRLYIAPAFTWRPDERTTLTILTHYQRSENGPIVETLPAPGTLFASPNGKLPRNRTAAEPDFTGQVSKEYSLGYALEHRFSQAISVRQNLRYDHLNVDAKHVFSIGLDPDDPAQRSVFRFAYTAEERATAFAVDNQIQADFLTGRVSHTLLAGVEYKHVRLEDAQGLDLAPSLDIFTPTYGATIARPPLFFDADTRQTQIGLYLHERMKIDDHWVVSLGGRQDFVSKERTEALSASSERRKENAFSGSVGLLYLADSGLAPYVTYSESFLPQFGSDLNGNAFVPETGRQYEAGVKFQPRGSDSFLSLAGFDLTRRNVLTPDPVNPIFNVQTGEQRSRGAEFEAVVSLLQKRLNVTAAYTYQDVETTKSNAGDVGRRPATVPKHMASIYADYAFPAGALAGLGIGAGIRYLGSTFGDAANTIEVPGFTVFDAAIRYDLGNLRFAVNAKNLFDKNYVADCFNFLGSTGCTYGAARTVVSTVRYRF